MFARCVLRSYAEDVYKRQSVELMRNDPDFANRPIMLFRSPLTDAQFGDLMAHHNTVLISSEEFRKLNIPVLP